MNNATILCWFIIELCYDGQICIVGSPTRKLGRVEVCVNCTWGL